MKLTQEQSAALKRMPSDRPNRLAIAFALTGTRQAEACEVLGLLPSQVSQLVRGDYKSVSVERARQFADFFGCQIEDLFPSKSEVA